MSGKVLKSMKHENPDVQKQIGCINGFFQLFERHRFLTSQHSSSSSHCQNTSISGGRSNHIKDQNSKMQKAKAKKNLKVAKEKQQFSTESSITSMSSSPSCSSSMSSLEFNRTIQTEPPSMSQIKIPQDPSSKAAMKQLDLYDVVKESMHRETRVGLSVKTVAKEEKKGRTHTLKYIDSPRPLFQSQKISNAGVMVSNESFHVLSKSKKAPWDSPRLSYDDGRDLQDTTFKSATKHKELPRLSLDSSERSSRGFNEGTKPRYILKGQQKGYGRSSSTMLNQMQESETSKRASSVVAKLMGLETLPACTQACETPQSSTNDEYKQHQSSVSPRTSKVSTLPQNVTRFSQFALESTPWRRPDATKSSQLQAFKGSESTIKAPNSSLSVYGEIEKRLAEIEFQKSGKDLRALKQILEAMQRYKDSFDATRDQASHSQSDVRNNSSFNESSKVQSPRRRLKDPKSVTVEMSNSTQGGKLPIVIMKPPKVTRKDNNPSSTEMSIHGKSGLNKRCPGNPTNGRLVGKLDKQTTKGISSTTRHIKDPYSQPLHSADMSNKMRTSKLMQSLKVPQGSNGENTANSGNVTGIGSPRLQKKIGLERHNSLPTSPSSDSSVNRRQHNRQSMELSSPSSAPRKKLSTWKERNEQFSEISNHWRDFKHHVYVSSSDFDREGSLATHSGIEVIHINQSAKLNDLNQNNAVGKLSKESFLSETIVTAEQPSPVSVLDAAFYKEDPPSPVKKKSDISEGLGEALSADYDSEDNSVDLPLDRDLNNQNLVEVLKQIDCSDEKFINFNDSKDPDHKYISEILLASGLLSGPGSPQICHSLDHLINPKLFFALEQMKANKRNLNIEDNAKAKMQRKLMFDVVNDILYQKLILESSSILWCQPKELRGGIQKGQHLLDELCSEIDQLQGKNRNVNLANEDEDLTSLLWGDLMKQPTIWTQCYSEIPNIVLDIERLIFKDLITEVLRGEVANNLGRHCRQLLFPK